MSLLNPFPHAFGLDITNFRIRFVDLRLQRSFTGKQRFSIKAFNQTDLPEGVVRDGDIKDEKKVVEILKGLLTTAIPHRVGTRFVVTALPEPKTFLKVIEIPFMEDEEVGQGVRWEIEKHLPFSIDEVILDHQILSHRTENNKMSILVGAAERKVVQSYHSVLKDAGLIPLAIEIEAIAIARALLNDVEAEKPQLIIDIGRSRTNLILLANGTVQFTTALQFSGETIVQRLMDKLAIKRDEAIKLRDLCGLDPRRCRGEVRKIVQGSFDDLLSRIDTALQFYQDHIANSTAPTNILLTGSNAQIVGLEKIISDYTKIPAAIANPMQNIEIKKSAGVKKQFQNIIPGLSTAIGCAIRGSKSDVQDE